MHWTALAGTKGTRPTNSWRSLRPGTLKNRLARNGSSRRRTHCTDRRSGLRCWCRRSRTRRRSLIDGTWSGLGNNHARCRWLRRGRNRRSGWTRRAWSCGSKGRRGSGHRWRGRRRWSDHYWWRSRGTNRWRSCCRGRSWCRRCNWNGRLFSRRRHNRGTRSRSGRLRSGNGNWRCRRRRGSSRLRCRSHDCGPRGSDRRRGARWRRRGGSFLLLRDRLEHITRTGNVRQINLGLDFFFAAQCARRARRRRLRFRRAADVGSYFFRFVVLQRTGMGLLLRHPDER